MSVGAGSISLDVACTSSICTASERGSLVGSVSDFITHDVRPCVKAREVPDDIGFVTLYE